LDEVKEENNQILNEKRDLIADLEKERQGVLTL
jgi:hypothetical protein